MLKSQLLQVGNTPPCAPVRNGRLLHAEGVGDGYLGAEILDDLVNFHIVNLLSV